MAISSPGPLNVMRYLWLPTATFVDLFTASVDVVFAFHGYPRAIHEVLHGRPGPGRFHVHGYREQGTTTTPFDMVVLNATSRYHLALEALHRARRLPDGAPELIRHCKDMLARHRDYIVELAKPDERKVTPQELMTDSEPEDESASAA